jgi:penicillin V acylase-like amidase (Ntn superfamily)
MMTLLETQYPAEESKTKMFMMQWIQYILDTCDNVPQVIESANSIH